jgi:hypothetical protein
VWLIWKQSAGIKRLAGLLEYFLIRDADIMDIAMGDSGRAG